MSVLARKRKLSELKFYDNAIRLRRSMIYLLMRDLGAKRGVRDIKWMVKDIPPQVTRQYLSWRGDKKWYNAHRTVRNMDILYGRLKNG